MKNPFKNQQGQVRWGYKFFSLILIWDMVIPVIILGIALAFTLAFRILLMNMGIMDGDGVLMESYRGQADNWYMVILMCIQNLVIIFLPFALWKWGFHSSWKNLGIHGKTWLRDMGKGLLLGAVMITLVAAGICLTGNASVAHRLSCHVHISGIWRGNLFQGICHGCHAAGQTGLAGPDPAGAAVWHRTFHQQ